MDAIILKPVVEIAKSGAKSIDPARDLCGFVARVLGTVPEDVVGIVAGDPMRQVRTRNCIRLAHRTGEILAGRGVKETVALSATIALPLLAAAQDEGREEMQEMWARMLANAMSPAKAETMRLEFVDALRRLHPRDTQILAEDERVDRAARSQLARPFRRPLEDFRARGRRGAAQSRARSLHQARWPGIAQLLYDRVRARADRRLHGVSAQMPGQFARPRM